MSEAGNIVKGIDHLIVMVQDLDRSERRWQALGFATTPRGFHQSGGTANHLLMLDRTYIELLGTVDPTSASAYRGMMASPGLWGVALRGSADETFQFWRSHGFAASPPTSLARPVDVGGRHELARFRLTMLERSAELPFLLFCCEHLTPGLVWQSDTPRHPNGARRLVELVLVVDDQSTQGQLERITGTQASHGSLALGESRISLLSEEAFLRRFGAEAGFRAAARPVLAACVLATTDLPRARRFAQEASWPIRETPAGGFVGYVRDEGVVIEWTPEP